jgi:tetratricopeptide (TPR) repeat protein
VSPLPGLDPRAARRAEIVLWGALVALAVARAAAAFAPSMWAWGLNLQRFLPPWAAWAPWAVAAVALLPPVAKALGGPAGVLGRMAGARPRAFALVLAALAAALVAALPDRVWFLGDILMRYGTVEYHHGFLKMFPQSLPLDVWLHETVPHALFRAFGIGTLAYARALGALAAALLAACAVWFARELRLGGPAALAAVAIALFGGQLCMDTGYLKTAGELCVLTAVVAAAGLRMIRTGRGAMVLGVALSLALTLHRSSLVLLPAAAVAWVLWARAHGGGRAWRRPSVWVALAVPVATLLVMGPRIAHVLDTFDRVHHFATPGVRAAGGLARSALAGWRALDLANAALLFAPLAVALPPLALVIGRHAPRRAATLFLATLALSFLAAALAIHPQQGLFRDWDVLAPAGVALALVTAACAGLVLSALPRPGPLALALALASAMPATQWLLHAHDLDRGLARVHSFVVEAPLRSADERGRMLDYLGDRCAQLERWDDAANFLAEAASLAPSPRVMLAWAIAEAQRGNLEGARAAYRRLTERAPADAGGWAGLATMASQLGDREEGLRAARALERLRPGNPVSRKAEDYWAAVAARDSAGARTR